MYFFLPFEGKYIYVREVWQHGVYQHHKGSPFLSGEQATEASSIPLSGGLESDDQNIYTEVGTQLHNLIGGSQQVPKLLHGGSFEVTSFA
jgi:hypothetical protein